MTVLSYDRYCDEIAAQTGLLTSAIAGADLTVPVPSCPAWNVGQLVRHLGGAQRWAAEIVRARAAGPVPGDFGDLSAYAREDPAVAVDAIDEWLQLSSLPIHLEYHPEARELLGPGRTLHFHATDTEPQAAAEWIVDLTGDAITWRRAHEQAAVAVRAPLTDLLLLIYKRRHARGEDIAIFGDADLLDFWLERVSFG